MPSGAVGAKSKRGWLLDLLWVGLVALVVRCVRLGSVPPGLDRDAAANGLYALDLLQRGIWPFFVLHMGVAEPLMVYLQTVSVALLGTNVIALRAVSAFAGALTACGVYMLARELWQDDREPWGRVAALVSAFGLALCPVHVHISRMGLRAILSPLLQVIVLAAFVHGWRTGRRWAFALAGVALGMGVYSYLAFRALWILLPLWILFLFLSERSTLRARWHSLLLMVGCAAMWVVPAIPLFLRTPAALWGRAGQVTLWRQPLVAERGWAYVLSLKLWAQLKMFGLSWPGQYNEMGWALLDPILLVVFCIGLGRALTQPRRLGHALSLLGLLVMLLPDLFSSRLYPHQLRVLGVVPFAFLLVGLGAITAGHWVSGRLPRRLLGRNRWLWESALVLALCVWSAARLYDYLVYWAPQAQATDDYHYHLTEVAEAAYLVHSQGPVLIPLAEYERTVLRYLIGGAFPVHRSALDGSSRMRVGACTEGCTLLMPREPDRRRLEGASYVHDPARYALLQAGTAYLLPALDQGGEATLSAAMAEVTCERVRDVNGQDVAMACRLDPLSLTYVNQAAHPMSMNLDDQIELVGYTLTDWRLEPGGQVSLALTWEAKQSIGADYRLFVHLIDPKGSVLAYGDTTPGMGTYPTTYWRSGETVPTFHRLSVPADLPPGRYEIEVGFYHPLSLHRLPVVGASGAGLAQRILVGPLKVPLPVMSDVPISDRRFQLGEAIQLAGYEVVGQEKERWAAKAGDVVHLRLAWAALDRPAADYTVFVHLSAVDERILAQHDGQPLDGTYPTSVWEQGEVIVEDIALTIAGDAAPGTYRFWVGMYDPLYNQRLPIFDVAGQQQPDDRVLVGELHVSGNGP